MKILQVLPELGAGGVERTSVDIARALAAAGFVPHVASAGGPQVSAVTALMARGDHVIANSEYTKAHIIKTHGTQASRITAIPRGVDLSAFALNVSKGRIEALRAHWGSAPDERVLLLPGRLTRWKGQLDAIAAMDPRAGLTLVIQGDPQGRSAYVEALKAAIAKSTARIIIAPPHADMAAAYAASFGVISASNEPEAFGRVCAEACAMGRPVIATAHGGSVEILQIGSAAPPLGLIAVPGDIASLRAQIMALGAMDHESAAAFAERAQSRARRLFTNSAMCASTLAVYRQLLGE
jgi:glycosyltransferase involved in cell wall biosynthesis